MWGNLVLLVTKIATGGFLHPSNASALSFEGVPKILFLQQTHLKPTLYGCVSLKKLATLLP